MYKVGIPQGLFFYDYFILWNTFFKELDVEVILSNKTNKKILNKGVSLCVDDACLPVKIFHGHVNDLKDRVDFLFIPRIKSVCKGEYECPKIIGIPEMIKNSISDLPPIINPKIDITESKLSMVNAILNIGKYFTNDLLKINRAYKKAMKNYLEYKENVKNGVLPIDILNNSINKKSNNNIKIFVLGHTYNVYDTYISMNLIEKLREQNVDIVIPDSIDEDKINFHASKFPKKIFWNLGRKTIGSTISLIEEGNINGIIYISSFGCGVDSVLIDLIQRRAISKNMPFTLLTVDEHTGEAGINTRIEAFLDMIKWRNSNENNISTHG